jgi:pyruvate/2-oxoglutarate dehydrogenase complex dihydrolipoamide acyltransferase (E2) component
VADTVLIAAPEHLTALKNHSSFAGAQVFPDADALKALEAITRDKPKLIVLERTFAATSRGAALIKRIKADPALVGCEIKIVAHDGTPATGKKKKSDGAAAAAPAGAATEAAATEAAVTAAAAPPVPTKAPLDQRGTRRAPRFNVVGGIEVLIDGKPATLINLSTAGAQVVSPTILRPNQRVRMVLPDAERQLRFAAGIAWAAFEMPKAGPHYRAGIEFFDAEAENVDKFIEANKA